MKSKQKLSFDHNKKNLNLIVYRYSDSGLIGTKMTNKNVIPLLAIIYTKKNIKEFPKIFR